MSTTSLDPVGLLDALRQLRCVDLSYPLHSAMPYVPRAGAPFERIQTATLADRGVNSGRISMSEHQGTHLDAPRHFVEGRITAEAIPTSDLVVEAVVIDCSAEVASDVDHRLTAAEVLAWEAANGRVSDGAFVLVRTGWGIHWSDPARYVGADADGALHHPAVHPEAAELLVERGASGVGIDTLSVDNSAPSDVRAPSHKVIHGADRYVMENLARLEELPSRGILLVIGALPLVEGTAGPARVLAFVRGS